MPGKSLGRIIIKRTLQAVPANGFRYIDCHNFSHLSDNIFLANQLVTSYQAIFADPDGWGEEYTKEEVIQKLRDELAGHAMLRIALDEKGEVAAFCWAQLLDVKKIASAVATIKYYQAIGKPDVIRPLSIHFDNRQVIYLHDLGIEKRYRGCVPLTQLIYPILDTLEARTGIGTVLFWSVADTNISRLAKRALFHSVLTLDDMRFYSGSLWSSKTRPERHSTE